MADSPGSPNRRTVIIALLAVYFIWGSTYLAIRFAVETIPPFLHAAMRFAIAGAVVYFIMRARGAPRPSLASWKPAVITGGLLLLGGNGLVSFAEQSVASGITALIIAIVPLFVTLIDWAGPRRKQPSLIAFAGIGLGLFGVALLVDPFGQGQGATHLEGAALLITASLIWSFGTIYGRTAKLPDPPFLAIGMEMIGGAACLLVASAVTGEFSRFNPAGISERSAWAFVYLVTVGALGGFSAYLWLIRNVTAQLATTYAFVNPVVAVVLGAWLASEPLTPLTVVAAAIIIAAVAVITQAPRWTAFRSTGSKPDADGAPGQGPSDAKPEVEKQV